MQTIRLRINDKIYNNLLWLLGKFEKDEIEIITEDKEFLSVQSYLEKELIQIEEGKASFHTIEELENDLDKIINEQY